MDIERLETERLVATKPLLRDAEEMHEAVMGDPAVAAWIWPGDLGGARTPSQVRAFMLRDADHWKRHRFGPWVVRDRATREVVGRVGIQCTQVGGADEVELAWMIASRRWGEGLATEAARAAVRAAFEGAGLAELVAFTLHDNHASRAVMTKLGMTYERDLEHAGLPHVLYRLRAA